MYLDNCPVPCEDKSVYSLRRNLSLSYLLLPKPGRSAQCHQAVSRTRSHYISGILPKLKAHKLHSPLGCFARVTNTLQNNQWPINTADGVVAYPRLDGHHPWICNLRHGCSSPERQIDKRVSLWAYSELQRRVKLVGRLECWDMGLQLFTGACEEAQDCVRAAGAGGQT